MNSFPSSEVKFFIGQGATLHGSVTVDGLAVIEGRLKGHLSAKTVLIQSTGVVEGSVAAGSLVVLGKITNYLDALEQELAEPDFGSIELRDPGLLYAPPVADGASDGFDSAASPATISYI